MLVPATTCLSYPPAFFVLFFFVSPGPGHLYWLFLRRATVLNYGCTYSLWWFVQSEDENSWRRLCAASTVAFLHAVALNPGRKHLILWAIGRQVSRRFNIFTFRVLNHHDKPCSPEGYPGLCSTFQQTFDYHIYSRKWRDSFNKNTPWSASYSASWIYSDQHARWLNTW